MTVVVHCVFVHNLKSIDIRVRKITLDFHRLPGLLLPIINMAREIYFEDDDEEDLENIVEKIENFAELTVPLMRDNEFQMHFRMKPHTFEDLLKKLHHTAIANNINIGHTKPGYPRTELEKEVMITIWYLGNLECFRSVANRFGVTKSTCWSILNRTTQLLLQMNRQYNVISWPNQQRQAEISNGFERNNFTGVIECIDGSHIEIVAPRKNHNSYINRKNYHSLLLQGVCDHNMLFTDVYAGEAGSIHDYTLYRRSDLYRGVQDRSIVFYNNAHLLGDLAYKLDVHLLVGFKDNGHLTLRMKNFNRILSKIRIKIENAFALLKGRFRRLKLLETIRLDLAVLNIIAACVLHNICILNGDPHRPIMNVAEELQREQENNPRNLDGDIRREIPDAQHAVQKRNDIVNRLPIIINN